MVLSEGNNYIIIGVISEDGSNQQIYLLQVYLEIALEPLTLTSLDPIIDINGVDYAYQLSAERGSEEYTFTSDNLPNGWYIEDDFIMGKPEIELLDTQASTELQRILQSLIL